jgi:peptide/nickel transport system substrate-binding protein
MNPASSARAALGLALGLAAVVGCDSPAGRGPARSTSELVVGAAGDATPSGAFQARLGVYPLNTNVAEPLVRLAPDYTVEPLLATRWELHGANTWRFHLRQGVRFHDGQPLDARAVHASLVQVARGGLGYSFVPEEGIRIVDDSTVELTPDRPNLRLPEQLVHPNYSIFAAGTDPAVNPVGTGPFRFVEYLPQQRIVVTRNDAYWGEKPRLDRITFRFFPDAVTRTLALSAGEIDLLMDLPKEQVASIERHPELRVVRAPPGLIMALQLNSHGQDPYSLLSRRDVRLALGLAIDRERLVRNVWNNEGLAVQNMTVPEVLGRYARLVRGLPYDPARSATLLDREGWRVGADGIRERGGRRLRLVLLANPEVETETPEFIQAELRKVGVEVDWVKLPDIGSYAARLNRGEFDLNLGLSNQNDANPLFLPALIYYSKSTRPFARWHYVGLGFDRLVEQGMRTTDPAEAQRLAAEAIHLAVDEAQSLLPIAALFRLYALRAGVEGFDPHPSSTNQSWVRVGWH